MSQLLLLSLKKNCRKLRLFIWKPNSAKLLSFLQIYRKTNRTALNPVQRKTRVSLILHPLCAFFSVNVSEIQLDFSIKLE